MDTPDHENYTEINSHVIDGWVRTGWQWSIPIDHQTYLRAAAGDWGVVLTPTKLVPKEWFPVMDGAEVLGLASAGGQQMPTFSALGARCTVLDISDQMLENERIVAAREGYEIEILRGDMTQPLPFEDERFDLIFHPVSNCYIEDVRPVWQECFRVLKPGGILMAGLDNGLNYAVDDDETQLVRKLPFNPLNDPEIYRQSVEQDWGIQFSHTIEEQVDAQLRAGFILTHIYSDTNGEGRLHELNIPTFFATRAVKPGAV